MIDITVICVGKLKEKFYFDAAAEYIKRLSGYCKITVTELGEAKRPASPSEKDISAALSKEAEAIKASIPKGAVVIALCIEGRELSSEDFSSEIQRITSSGSSKLCFLIGGSDGLAEDVKKLSSLRLSMSPMTFPHHLARVMLLEQIYRALNIASGGKYHK